MTGGKAGRAIPIVNLALGYALQQDEAKGLRAEAVRHVSAVIKAHKGSTHAIREALGISTGTFSRWVRACPELQAVQHSWRDESTPGRVPDALAPKRRRRSKK